MKNKIKTSEHDNQLNRYYDEVEKAYPKAQKIYIYLTPDNLDPSEEKWISFDYSSTANLLDNILKYKADSLGENIYTFINQYIHILKRYLVGQSEIEKICTQIYKKHKAALDLIFEYKPDIQNEISEHMQGLVNQKNDLIVDSAGKSMVRFSTKSIDDKFPKISEGWVRSKRIILYEIMILPDRVAIRLYLGPGDQSFRIKFNDFVNKKTFLFNKANRTPGVKYHCIYQKEILKRKDFEDLDQADLFAKIDQKWEAFISKDKQEIDDFLSRWDEKL